MIRFPLFGIALFLGIALIASSPLLGKTLVPQFAASFCPAPFTQLASGSGEGISSIYEVAKNDAESQCNAEITNAAGGLHCEIYCGTCFAQTQIIWKKSCTASCTEVIPDRLDEDSPNNPDKRNVVLWGCYASGEAAIGCNCIPPLQK